uniref:Uncharacterized protein n=1 Tax=Chromera velia CCMP2878 TaxID=1169474 RepID=A0A0G4FKL0_9ALVE|eukprot:Cvel_17514.t1-p1 / transcript=Cvel_17514.t1 / gene=Cvel_17514 / organism=Chromera_velia_CCMP2878 / gene_product=hypothetical protein / transcript_product=hypothetical protein / location=Cvel_scaffold1403:39268-40611(+) / protein_length=448 / sequence_SO=supercontig / SO=protein_coding / is_pseudo=false
MYKSVKEQLGQVEVEEAPPDMGRMVEPRKKIPDRMVVKPYLPGHELKADEVIVYTFDTEKTGITEWVLVKMRVADAANLKAMNKDALESSMKVEVMNKQAYDRLIVPSRKMKKGGEINEKAHIGMMEVKEACDEMVEGVLMPMLQMPLDGVFLKFRREYMMMQKGMEYREYNRRLMNKVRSEGAAYIDAHLATEHIAARAGAQVDVVSEILCSVAEMVKEHRVMEIHGRVVRLQKEMKKTGRGGGSGPMGGKHSMYPTCDIQSGGITVEDVDVDGPGVTEKGIPNTGVDVRQTGGGGMVNRGMNDGKKGDGGISLMVPNGRPRMNGNIGANGVGKGGMQDSFGRQTGTGLPKRVEQVTHSLEGKQGNTDSGFMTPRSMEEREGEGQQMQQRAVTPFRPLSAGRDRPTMNEMQIFPPNVPMVGGRITYETLVDLPVYRQPKNGGLGGKL